MGGAGMIRKWVVGGLALLFCSALSAQTGLFYTWQVTHTKSLAARLTGAEASRATLEANIAAQQSYGAVIGNFKVAEESYHALRTYAKFLKLIRMFRKVSMAYKSMDFRGREWALLPQIKMTAPTEVGNAPDGTPIIVDQDMLSLSLVQAVRQTDWVLNTAHK